MISKSKVVLAAVLAFLLGAALPALVVWNPAGWHWADRLTGRDHEAHAAPGGESAPAGKQLWTCGMHPQVIQDEPGYCPICQMRLVPVKGTTPAALEAGQEGAAAPRERKVKYWRAPMDPNFISDKPGKSPMGMDLVPVYEDEAAVETGVRVDPSFLQNFAVRTAVAERGSIPVDIRTVGMLAHNEKNLVSVNTKFEGWIEKAYYNNVGEHVQRGAVLFEIYSPQLVTTQKEYLAAKQYVDKVEASGYGDAVERARSLLEAARERLAYWDISDEQIAELNTSGKVRRTLQVRSPASGHIVSKTGDSLEGMRVMPGMTILTLADHTVLWAEVEFYEFQLQHLREGQSVRVEVDAFPGRRWSGKIVYFNPFVNPQTRTLKAFVEIPNKDLKLRPQMFANVSVETPAVSGAVKVPLEAVLRTGERAVVIVQKVRGLFEPREVQLGSSGGGFQEIRQGLAPGEVVVTSSQFLIDSESNLKAAISQMLGERGAEGGAAGQPAPPTPHQH